MNLNYFIRNPFFRHSAIIAPLLLSVTVSVSAVAQSRPIRAENNLYGGRLLATGGVTTLEGTAGGGIVPWALIGGYGTEDQFGANAFATHVHTGAYDLTAYGGLIGAWNRVEFSVAHQILDTGDVGRAVGLGKGADLEQTILGAKLRLYGDAVLDQDTFWPQLSAGVQFKDATRGSFLRAVGADSDQGVDFNLSATKIFLAQSLLVNTNIRFTKSNQMGLLGFDGGYRPQFEASVAWLAHRNWVFGAEYRGKPNRLGPIDEDDWFDFFVAWVPNKHVSVTLAYADLGTIAIRDHQRGLYLSLQAGF